MFWTFNLSLDILATVWASFPNILQILFNFLVTLVMNKDFILSAQKCFLCKKTAKNGQNSWISWKVLKPIRQNFFTLTIRDTL